MIQIKTDEHELGESIQFLQSRTPSRERMRRVGEAIVLIVKGNFLTSGRPDAWPKLRDGSTSQLMRSGALINSVHIASVEEDRVVVRAGDGLPYARIHQTGGIIKWPGTTKLQVFEIGGQLVFIKRNKPKPHDIPIPKRRYMNIPPDSMGDILRAYTAPVN